MARKNTPNFGSLKKVHNRWYYNAKLPGTEVRKSYALIPAGKQHSTTDKRLAVALANRMWKHAESLLELEDSDINYDGSISSLKELYIEAHKKDIADKETEVQNKELRFIKSAINDLIDFLKSVPFSLATYELKSNRIILWRKYLSTEKGVCRTTINKKVNTIKLMVRYAVNRELEPADLQYNIDSIKSIKKGQENFKDYAEVNPVDWSTVEKILPYLNGMICDMLKVMRLTGARPGEVRIMRPCDIDQTDSVAWVFRPLHHKTERHDLDRAIVINPEAQVILKKYMFRSKNLYCFPAHKNSTKIDNHYTTHSFAKVITRAVNQYNNDHPEAPIKFHANQLRHAFATEVCLKHGLEITRCALGHTSTAMTKRYARKALAAKQLLNAKEAVKKSS